MSVTEGAPAAREERESVRTVRVGLLPAPELPAQIAAELAAELPELLEREHDGRWRVVVAEEPLLAGRGGVEEIVAAGDQIHGATRTGTPRSA
jgi:hypothetical protein